MGFLEGSINLEIYDRWVHTIGQAVYMCSSIVSDTESSQLESVHVNVRCGVRRVLGLHPEIAEANNPKLRPAAFRAKCRPPLKTLKPY